MEWTGMDDEVLSRDWLKEGRAFRSPQASRGVCLLSLDGLNRTQAGFASFLDVDMNYLKETPEDPSNGHSAIVQDMNILIYKHKEGKHSVRH